MLDNYEEIFSAARPIFEVVILEDLYNFLLDPENEMAKQKVKYKIPG